MPELKCLIFVITPNVVITIIAGVVIMIDNNSSDCVTALQQQQLCVPLLKKYIIGMELLLSCDAVIVSAMQVPGFL